MKLPSITATRAVAFISVITLLGLFAVPLTGFAKANSDSGYLPFEKSTLVTTNRGLPEWGNVFGDTVVASAILDRLIHRAVVFNIKGPSWRLREHQALATAATDPERR